MSKTTQILNEILSQELSLYLRTWNYHWNVEGPQFPALHEMFESGYVELRGLIDELAERVRALGGVPSTMVNLAIEGLTPAAEMLKTLAAEHRALSARLVGESIPAIGGEADPGTVDLLTRILQVHDKFGWMLNATAR
jgi:starvation-inducible DNA-binding protein